MPRNRADTDTAAPPVERGRSTVHAWFERTYRERGLRYLRPPAAYPIYLQLLGARAGQRLLDVGCGPGLLLGAARAREVAAHGIDIAPTALKMASQRVPSASVVLASATELPYADGSFDHVTCIGVLERLSDRPRALAEMARVLRPGGRLCCMVRNANSLSWRIRRGLRRQDHHSHQDAASLAQWREAFEATGFLVDTVHIDQWWRQRLRRLWRGRPDPTRDEPVARPVLPLRLALEFIFLLQRPAATASR
ncbi:MAG: class I SAM-dependent methyltransferase [Planctomycetota bacterium]